MLFHFKAKKENGESFEGTREATDKFALYRDLKKENIVVFSAEVVSVKKNPFRNIFSFIGYVSFHDKILFARNIGLMVEAGLPLSRALTVIERQTKSRALKKVVSAVSGEVEKGKPFHEALKVHSKVFPNIMVAMVKTGEESGRLAGALKNVADQMDKTYALQRKVKGALIYPAIILCIMIIIGILMLYYVVPTLTSTFSELKIELPLSTKMIVAVSNFLRDHTLLAGIGLFVLYSAVHAFLKSKIGKLAFDRVSVHLPLIGPLVQEVNSAQTARTLSSLLSSGVEVVSALLITAEVLQNSLYVDVITRASETIQKGNPIAKIFAENEHIYPPFMGEMTAVGEETGKLSDMLSQTATFFETEVDQKTKNLSTIIEPILMVFIGTVVGFFAYAMIVPTLSLANAL